MLPAQLYVPTVNMIKALSRGTEPSKAAFKLLRAATGNLSWDRIFDSLREYCDNLRADLAATVRGVQMTPEESAAMVAVIELAGTVCHFDSNARQIMLEQQNWRVPLYLLQLMRCPIEPKLKVKFIPLSDSWDSTMKKQNHNEQVDKSQFSFSW